MNLSADTLSDEIEPYLLREQMIVRSSRGRMATTKAYQHLGKPVKRNDEDRPQGLLFD
jgi:Holliday junction DNA helicase RuvB